MGHGYTSLLWAARSADQSSGRVSGKGRRNRREMTVNWAWAEHADRDVVTIISRRRRD